MSVLDVSLLSKKPIDNIERNDNNSKVLSEIKIYISNIQAITFFEKKQE